MSKFRWAKMWWSDWSDDPALRLCSLAAQGLWMRMLCIAASQNDDHYGHVLVAGRPPSAHDLARIVGAPGARAHTITQLLTELERHGVCSKDASGVYQSRRLCADFEQHLVKQRAGSEGGNPQLRPTVADPVVNHLDNLDSESESESRRTPRGRARARGYRNGFDESAAADMQEETEHAETGKPSPGGATVVPITGGAVRR